MGIISVRLGHISCPAVGNIFLAAAVHGLLPHILYCCNISREEIFDSTPICTYLHMPNSQSRIFIFGGNKNGVSYRGDGKISGEAEGLSLLQVFELLNSRLSLELFILSP